MTASRNSDVPVMWVPSMDACLSRWFRTYEEAAASRRSEGGYLFPYKNQFFVTESEAVRELGLDPSDPDWESMGWDWVKPLDHSAWERLKRKRMLKEPQSTGERAK